jgi:tetratricopeptide (TPR) repeat protein
VQKRTTVSLLLCLVLLRSAPSSQAQQTSSGSGVSIADPRKLFEQGELALKDNQLERAERDFRGVLAVNPEVAGAYANLGVIYMRRKQWSQALEMLHKAEHLAPDVVGIRLNIGLAYFRQDDFRSAIAPFESVVRDAPDSYQGRYLLGLCYFLTEQYRDAAAALEPLWPQASDQFNYLYVLGIAACKSFPPQLEQRALGRLGEIGQDTPEFHLILGKALENREQYDDAVSELETAAKANPKLRFVHFYLGEAYFQKQALERAKQEFRNDIALEPDVAYNYDQLGLIEYLQQQDLAAEKDLLKALHLNPGLGSSHYQLARCLSAPGKVPTGAGAN